PGVKKACQYTVPVMDTLTKVGMGSREHFSTREMHQRECYVVADHGADCEAIRKAIVEMPGYFAPYNTTVSFVSEEEFLQQHSGMPHGGLVIRTGESEGGPLQVAQFQLNLASNPHFTAAVMVAYARAALRLARSGAVGAFTCLDIPPAYLSEKTHAELLEGLL
ncbi:diaminopimelate dehydrogenase, partial [Ruminococcaceae bacterium OttesenSCG-928-N02]|nr:diaminopimelate dehydrogenase [Ruminococcaceae bacterium OttesenSCG-928-N02]